MQPGTHLAVLAAGIGFLLKTALGFGICWLITKAAIRPGQRFAVWFTWLSITGIYWLWLLAALLPHPPLVATVSPSSLVPVTIHPRFGAFQIQSQWAAPLAILIRALEFAYLLTLLCFLFMAAKKHLRLRWILRFTYEAPDEIDALFRPIADSTGARNVQLLMLSGIHSPATVGWIRPIIVLPPACTERDRAELTDILRHELQHIRRRDFVFTGIASFFRALLFFHPGVWYARRRLGLESEFACDLAAIGNSPQRRADYAESLLSFARLQVTGEPAPWNLDFARASSQLQVRIRSILAETRTIPRWMIGLRAASGALLLTGFIAAAPSLFVVFSWQQPLPTASFVSPAVTRGPALHAPTRRADLRAPSAHAHRASYLPLPDSPAAAPDTTAEPLPAPPPKPEKGQINTSDPALLHRGDPSRKTGAKQPSGTILLSNEGSDSADSASRRASVASSIAAGATEALSVASRDHKDIH